MTGGAEDKAYLVEYELYNNFFYDQFLNPTFHCNDFSEIILPDNDLQFAQPASRKTNNKIQRKNWSAVAILFWIIIHLSHKLFIFPKVLANYKKTNTSSNEGVRANYRFQHNN